MTSSLPPHRSHREKRREGEADGHARDQHAVVRHCFDVSARHTIHRCVIYVYVTVDTDHPPGIESWSHVEDEVMRRGGVAERVIDIACAARKSGSREASTSLSWNSRVRVGEWKFFK